MRILILVMLLPALSVQPTHAIRGLGRAGSLVASSHKSDYLPFVDTEMWLGAEYTPAAAPANGLWWAWFDRFVPSITRELSAANRMLRLTTIRVFLHSMVFAHNSTKLMEDMDTFLSLAEDANISVGFVFFGDCFNHQGGSVTVPCTPVKGLHNGCWMASPQDIERENGVESFKSYVTDTISRFKTDHRIRWWEIFNEPSRTTWSLSLRDAGYRWAKAVEPLAPVLSCWDDNNDTDIVDHHDYGTGFKSSWLSALYSNPGKGAVVTEAGSRWFQPQPIGAINTAQTDQGSPLTVLNFLEQLRVLKVAGKVPYVPGAMVCWELMVGNSNTRWHWNTAVGSNEPAIPWDAWLFPDGTPISHTEAAAFRKYVTGTNEFLAFEDFLPDSIEDGDVFQSIEAGSSYTIPNNAKTGPAVISDALVEMSIWVDGAGDGVISVALRAGSSIPSPPVPPNPEPNSTSCKRTQTFNDTDIPGTDNYRNFDLRGSKDPMFDCFSECCGWDNCGSWIVRALTDQDDDHNCSYNAGTRLCCWLKVEDGSHRVGRPGTTAGIVTREHPPGPPLPEVHSGLQLLVNASSEMLLLVRNDGKVGDREVLGTFDLSTLENGLVLDAWNMLRVLLDGPHITVWFNPMFPETGFVGNISDAERTPKALPPRISVIDSQPLSPGAVIVSAGHRPTRIDYVSALPTSVALHA